MPSLAETIRTFCRAVNLRLNKELGQHFLIDEEVLRRIVDAAQIQPTDHIVEIGPGIGVLTKELLAVAARVTSIELDERMLGLLAVYTHRDGQPHPNLEMIHANALDVAFPSHPYKIVANIPYHITSPLLRHAFLESPEPPASLTLLIQREVAEKICDTHSTSLLTILVGLFGTPRIVCSVPPSSFLPPPKVDSAVLHIQAHPRPLAERETIEDIWRLAKVAFSGKRKMLRNTLGNLSDGLGRLEKAGIDPMRRPETLSIAEWMRIAGRS